jgi:hypothetical protein
MFRFEPSVVSSSDFETLITTSHIVTRGLLLSRSGGHTYEAKGSVSTAMLDLGAGTTNNETLGERVTPSGTPVTDYTTVDVPYDPASTGTTTPPTQQTNTPTASGVFYDNAPCRPAARRGS